jgi:hypothetical protein
MKMLPLVLLVGVVYLVLYLMSDQPGYCRAQQRYISDEEFSQTSLALLAWDTPRRKAHWDINPKLYEYQLKANDRMEHNRNRPGFVSIDRSDTRTIFRWLFGYQQIQLILNANSGDEFIRMYFDGCGKLIASDLGHPYSGHIDINTNNYLEMLNKK